MRIDPAIAALRCSSKLQRRAQAEMRAAADAWRNGPDVAKLLEELGRFADGAELAECPGIHAALTCGNVACELATSLCRCLVSALARDRFGQVPFRHGFDGRTSTLLLARAGRAHLILQAIEPGRRSFATAGFSDAGRHEIVLAGSARARVVRCPGFAERPLRLEPGFPFALDLSREALQVLDVDRRLVLLRLHRAAVRPGPSREYALAEGMLVHQSSGDLRASRREMAIAVLGRMDRAEAAPAMAALAREAAGDRALRWQALRECLALDAAEGFSALCHVAGNAGDPLAESARALRQDLARAYPALRQRDEPCLA